MKGLDQMTPSLPEAVTILSVSPIPEDHVALEHIVHEVERDSYPQPRWHLSRATSLSSALAALRLVQHPVVLCERDLPLGDWKDLLQHSNRLANPPFVIVTSRHADEYLWAEAMNLGAHDVLAKPFEPSEVIRVVSLACLRWHRDRRHAAPGTRLRPSSERRVTSLAGVIPGDAAQCVQLRPQLMAAHLECVREPGSPTHVTPRPSWTDRPRRAARRDT